MKGSLSGLSTPASAPVPAWCEWGRGTSPILLIAPHGGRRPPVNAAAPPRGLRVNDVYTPEITRELADVLDAGFVINTGMDRNALDLNRISQVRRHASWFLDLLIQEIEWVIGRHGTVELLFMHGWNTGQAICDVGIGGVATTTGMQVPDGARLTVSDIYLADRIEALRAACARARIRAPIGERYPGSHRNNLLQLFTARAAAIDDPNARRVAAWVADGRINALQLELGIPLRWPGHWRDAFVGAVADAFGSGARVRTEGSQLERQPRAPDGEPMTPPAALQFYDPAAGIGMFAGIGRMRPRATSGRLLLFLGGQRIALFTGEEAHRGSHHVGPFSIASEGRTTRLVFAGPILLLEDAAVYLDLEAALAASRVVDAEVELEFSSLQSSDVPGAARFGALCGSVCVDGRRVEVDSGAFANAGGFRAAGASQQTMLAAVFGHDRAMLSRVVDGEGHCAGLHFTDGAAHPLNAVRIAVSNDGDIFTPNAFELTCDGQPPLRAEPLSRMGILRPAGDDSYLRVTFGVARFQWGGQTGYGLYEHARPVRGAVRSDE